MQMKMKKPWKSYGGADDIKTSVLNGQYKVFMNKLFELVTGGGAATEDPWKDWNSVTNANTLEKLLKILVAAATVATPSYTVPTTIANAQAYLATPAAVPDIEIKASDLMTLITTAGKATMVAAPSGGGAAKDITETSIQRAFDEAAKASGSTTAPITTVSQTDITIDTTLFDEVMIPNGPDGLTAFNVKTDQMLKNVKITKLVGLGGIDVKKEDIKKKVTDKIPITLSKDVVSTAYSIGNDGTKLASTIASLMYAAQKLSQINEALQKETIKDKYTSNTTYVLYYVNKDSATFKDKPTEKMVNHIKVAFLKHQAKILTDMTDLLEKFTAQDGGKKDDKKQRRFKGGFQEADMGKMYDVQGLISDLSASHDQNIITNPNVYPNPFSAGGLSQSSEGIDANLSDSIKFDVVPSYNGGSKQKKASRRK